MELIRERHRKTREELKQLFIGLIQKNGFESSVSWNEFEFEGKTRGTTLKGEIFEGELHVEVSGWFEKIAAQKLRNGWKELALKSLV